MIQTAPEDPRPAEIASEIDKIKRALDQCENQILGQLRTPLDNRNPTRDLENRLQEQEVNMRYVWSTFTLSIFQMLFCACVYLAVISKTNLSDLFSRNLLRLWENSSLRCHWFRERLSLFCLKNPWDPLLPPCPPNLGLPTTRLMNLTPSFSFIIKSRIFTLFLFLTLMHAGLSLNHFIIFSRSHKQKLFSVYLILCSIYSSFFLFLTP